MQSQYQVKGLLEGLLWLKETALNTPFTLRKETGICRKLNLYCSDYETMYEYAFVEKASLGWVGHSGRKFYPVKDNYNLGCWEGENLEQRLSLLEHLIGVVEGMTNEECISEYGLYK
ncbi:MAG: hypothetical protein RR959_06130 [Erysipelotrichaceae bacterium]